MVSMAMCVSAQGLLESSDSTVILPLPQVEIEANILPTLSGTMPGTIPASATNNPMLWQQYQALNMPVASGEGSGCATCGGGQSYDRCGCNSKMFPWLDGPGNCDQWCVGPRWQTQFSGLMLFRENANWASVITDVGVAPTLIDQFDHGVGGRVVITGYNESSFGLQVAYEGVNDWNARAEFPLAGAMRTFDYESSFNSVELNFLPQVSTPWKFFGGVRYVEISERLGDLTVGDKTIPAPADPPAGPVAVIDTGTDFLTKNQLIGFQLGGLRDSWQWGQWLSIESFFNGGVYCNKFQRQDVARTITTITSGDDLSTINVNEFSQNVSEVNSSTRRNSTEIAFLGEAGITGVVRLNQCIALRGGYQVTVLDGVGEGLDGLFSTSFQRRTLLYHGLQFGIEYRR